VKNLFKILKASLTIGLCTASVSAVSFQYLDSFAFTEDEGPQGIVFDSSSDSLYIGAGSSTVYVYTTAGTLDRTFTTNLTEGIYGLSMYGSDLLLADRDGSLQQYTTGGVAVGEPIDISPPSGTNGGVSVGVSLGNSIIFVVDDNDEGIYLFDTDGDMIQFQDTEDYSASFDEPAGVAWDSVTDNIFVVDDAAGTNAVYEIDSSWSLLGVTYFDDLGGDFEDPEGIALDVTNNLAYVAFDNDQEIGIFSIDRSVPDTGSTAALLGVGVVALAFARRRLG